MKTYIAENIRFYRKLYKLTQAELGKAIYISTNQVSNYENESRTPDIYTLCKLVKFFDITLDELVEYEED